MLQLVPERLTAAADFTLSDAHFENTYDGFGRTNWDGTPFAHLDFINLRVEIPLKVVMLVAGYTFEKFDLEDWQRSVGPDNPTVEAVGADTLLRDSSRSHQWGKPSWPTAASMTRASRARG